MRKTWRNWTGALLVATAVLSAAFSSACARPEVTVIPEERMMRKLPNGNYEVTPAWLKERYEFERWAAEEARRCR